MELLGDCLSFLTKRTRRTVDSSCLIELLPVKILRTILQRLNHIDLVRLQAVSSYWNSLVEDQISPSPWLMLPSKQVIDGHDTDVNNNAYSGFLKLGETQVSNLRKIPKVFREGCCVGSSNGWLAFLEDRAVLSLFHPFRQVKIQLPSLLLGGLLGLKRLERNPEGNYEVEYFDDLGDMKNYTKEEIRYPVRKFVLVGEPDHNNENFDVIMLCNKNSIDSRYILLYYRSRIKSWKSISLDPRISETIYYDILWKEDHLYVLNEDEIEVFGFEDDFLIKMRKNIILTLPRKVSDTFIASTHIGFYLIESCGDILLAVRFISPLDDLRTSWRTRLFEVYKLDMNVHKLVRMESLGDCVLFVGDNGQSVSMSIQSFPDCERNSIYFTDYDWSEFVFNKEGDHDMGIYNMTDGSVKSILNFSSLPLLPPLYWIIPSSTSRHRHISSYDKTLSCTN